MSRNKLVAFWSRHPETRPSLEHWLRIARAAHWKTMQDVQKNSSGAKTLNAERARFEIHGGDYRLIVAFRFDLQIAYIKFIGTHAEYDHVDALTVAQF